MTTPTDPTTLRTALEALERFVQHYPRLRGLDPEDIYTINVAGDGSHPDILRLSDLRALTEFARAALATPAPAAEEARCAFVGCGGVRDDVFHEPCLPGGAFHDHKACHPFQPAPTPAQTTPPATEPVAALVEKLMWTLNALVDETWEQDDVEEVSRYLTAIVAAARAEVDVERLARALWGMDFADPDASVLAERIAARYRETADDR